MIDEIPVKTILVGNFISVLVVKTINFQGYQIPQYRCLPEVAVNSIETHGFGTMHIRNLEGVGANFSASDLLSYKSKRAKHTLFNTLCKECENLRFTGLVDQFLYVGRKKVEC